jgi:hypothetical protein
MRDGNVLIRTLYHACPTVEGGSLNRNERFQVGKFSQKARYGKIGSREEAPSLTNLYLRGSWEYAGRKP